MNAAPPAIPLSDIYTAALGMQLRAQAAAARFDYEALPPARLAGFRALLHIESAKVLPSLAAYCIAWPNKASGAIHEAAETSVSKAIKIFFSFTTAQ